MHVMDKPIIITVLFQDEFPQVVLREDTNEYCHLVSLKGKVIRNVENGLLFVIEVEVKSEICNPCKGSGEDWRFDTFRYCSACGGAGEREYPFAILEPACEHGFIGGDWCEVCDPWPYDIAETSGDLSDAF